MALLAVLVVMGFNLLPEYERAVILRWGRLARGIVGGTGPGIIIILPLIDRMIRVRMRTVTSDIPPQDVITSNNVTVKVNAVVYFRVMDPQPAIVEVEDYLYATSMISYRSVTRSTQISRESSIYRLSPGASRSPRWR